MSKKTIFRTHAIQRMFERRISEESILDVLKKGICIEDYPDDKPYPSKLMLGWYDTRPIHVVVANNSTDNEDIVITVYEPEIGLWSPDFKRRQT